MEFGNGQTNQLVWQSNSNRYHDEDFCVNENNTNVNVAVLANYVNSGEMILDVGCGEGKFGAVLRRKNCTIYGIDLDEEASAFAREHNGYQDVYLINMEDTGKSGSEYIRLLENGATYDVVAMIDILEHLINPTQAILNVAPLLKDHGKILVSIPNANNADIFLNLLNDQFNYREAGVLDNTHAKYFTKSSFVQWIAQMNELNDFVLDCSYVGSTYGYTSFMERVKKEYPAVYKFIQINPYFHVMQHLFVLTIYKQKDEANTKNLDELLAERPQELISVLERFLTGVAQKEPHLYGIQTLPNEREILEEQIASANAGWTSCVQELKAAEAKITELESALKEAERFTQKQDADLRALKDVNSKLISTEERDALKEELESANAGWTSCVQELKAAETKITELESALKEAERFTQKQDADLRALKAANNKLISTEERDALKEELESANAGWTSCVQELKAAETKITELESALKEAERFTQKQDADLRALKAANNKLISTEERDALKEELESANAGWTSCVQELKAAETKITELESALKEAERFTQKQDQNLAELKEENIRLLSQYSDLSNVVYEDMQRASDEARSYIEKLEHDIVELKQEYDRLLRESNAIQDEQNEYAKKLNENIQELKTYSEKLQKDILELKEENSRLAENTNKVL